MIGFLGPFSVPPSMHADINARCRRCGRMTDLPPDRDRMLPLAGCRVGLAVDAPGIDLVTVMYKVYVISYCLIERYCP